MVVDEYLTNIQRGALILESQKYLESSQNVCNMACQRIKTFSDF